MSLGPSAVERLWHEPFFVYLTQSSSSHHIVFSYALADEEGSSLLPSPLIRQLNEQFSGIETAFVEAEPAGTQLSEQLTHLSHPRQAIDLLSRQLQRWKAGETIAPIWWDVIIGLRNNPTGMLILRRHYKVLRTTMKR
ncbi:ATP-dependent nuclease, subunit B [Geomicrobium sp. JCM 19037]|nr:ATP-dependent nuclease, subunit B [Geomicrobium sp. JCM 19037]